MAQVGRIPPELVRMVFECLRGPSTACQLYNWPSEQSMLAQLCRVCKAFRGAAEAVLYRKVYLRIWERVDRKLLSLLVTLVRRPDLRQRISMLQLDVSPNDHDDDVVVRAEDVLPLTIEAIHWRIPFNAHWVTNIEKRQVMLSNLLLTQIRDIRELHLKIDFERNSHLITGVGVPSFSACSFTAPFVGRALEFTRLNVASLYLLWNTDYTSRLFVNLSKMSPNLSELSLNRFYIVPSIGYTFKNVRRLNLLDAHIRSEVEIAQLMGCFPKLQDFRYTRMGPHMDVTTPQAICRGLQQNPKILKTISVDIISMEQPAAPLLPLTFEAFENLTELSLDPLLFDPHDMDGMIPNGLVKNLPRSITKLVLLGWGELVEEDIKWLVEAMQQGDFPNFCVLHIYCCSSQAEEVYEMVEEIFEPESHPPERLRILITVRHH